MKGPPRSYLVQLFGAGFGIVALFLGFLAYQTAPVARTVKVEPTLREPAGELDTQLASAASNWCRAHPGAASPDAGNLDAGNPDAGHPDAGHPDAGNPDAGNPDPGNPGQARVDRVSTARDLLPMGVFQCFTTCSRDDFRACRGAEACTGRCTPDMDESLLTLDLHGVEDAPDEKVDEACATVGRRLSSIEDALKKLKPALGPDHDGVSKALVSFRAVLNAHPRCKMQADEPEPQPPSGGAP